MKFVLHFRLPVIFVLGTIILNAQNWSNWRGPNYNGSSNTSDSLPGKFDLETGVKWKFNLPGPSACTPIISDQFVFVSSIKISDESSGKGELLALCFNRQT